MYVYDAMGTHEYGPLQTLVNVIVCVRGLYGETLVDMFDSFMYSIGSLHFVAYPLIRTI